MNFFQKHCAHFNEEDENTHQTKNIHEEYIKILDETIEAQLLLDFQENEVNQFYMDMAEELKTYEKQNVNVVDILYAALDFAKFKQ